VIVAGSLPTAVPDVEVEQVIEPTVFSLYFVETEICEQVSASFPLAICAVRGR